MALELRQAGDLITLSDADLIKDGDPTVTYTVRRLTIDKWREIRRKHTKPGTYRKPEQCDEEAFQDALFDYVLEGWTNVVANGTPLPCDWSNKRLIELPRRAALIDAAGANEVSAHEEAREESFRPLAVVR